MERHQRGRLLLAALISWAVAAPSAAAVDIAGAGSTFAANLYFAWIDRFEDLEVGIGVRYESVGSGEGIRRFLEHDVDFGASERPLTDAEIAGHDGGALHVPMLAGLIAVAHNLPGIGDGVLRLTREALTGIFAGEITEWNDPAIQDANPGLTLPERTISIVARRDSSGTTFAFANHLFHANDTWRNSGREPANIVYWPPHSMLANGNEGVAGRLFQTEYAIGYVNLSFAKQLGLNTALIENREGAFVYPTVETGRNAIATVAIEMPDDGRQLTPDPAGEESYPIVSYSWVLVDEQQADPAKAAALRTFLEWGLAEGQELAEPLGYMPLPPEASEAARRVLDRMK